MRCTWPEAMGRQARVALADSSPRRQPKRRRQVSVAWLAEVWGNPNGQTIAYFDVDRQKILPPIIAWQPGPMAVPVCYLVKIYGLMFVGV